MSADTDQPRHPAQVIADNREVFETIATEAEDEEAAELFGRQPLQYLEEHREEVDDDE